MPALFVENKLRYVEYFGINNCGVVYIDISINCVYCVKTEEKNGC